jgi:hypothetical protein
VEGKSLVAGEGVDLTTAGGDLVDGAEEVLEVSKLVWPFEGDA